jgi:SAM-dependent methyltransferase
VPDRPPLRAILARGPRYIVRVGLLLSLLQLSERASGLIDLVLGVDTGGFVSAEELELSSTGHGFASSPWSTLRRVLPPSEVSPGDVFCDVGAGKGRILLAAAIGYRFARVLGIEVSPELVAIARRNLDALRLPTRSRAIAVEQSDMADLSLPDDVTIVYAYDPFEGDLFDALTRELIASVQRRPRALRFIYLAPYEEQQLLQTGRIRLIRRVRWGVRRLDPRWQGVALYEVV